jgi:hypothetical protein
VDTTAWKGAAEPSMDTLSVLHGYEGLEEATRLFVNREVALEGGAISASPVFQWFGADFAALPGGLSGFLARYLADEAMRRALLDGGEATLSWRPYDWRVPRDPSAGD